MPNWCVGILKIRSDFKTIVELLKNEIDLPMNMPYGIKEAEEGSVLPTLEFTEKEDYFSIELKFGKGYHVNGDLHLKGSRRMFASSFLEIEKIGDEELEVFSFDIESAWDIDVAWIERVSKQYQVDIKTYAFEKGEQFNRDIEYHKGEMIKNDKITFDSYEWECVDPSLGG